MATQGAGSEKPEYVVYENVKMGDNVKIWHTVLIRGDTVIGDNVSIGSYTEIGHHVVIEDNVRIHSKCFIPEGTILRDGCWVGPMVSFVNDKYPQTGGSYREGSVVGPGAIIGARSVIGPGITIGENSVIGFGSVVIDDIPKDTVYAGNPAKFIKFKKDIGAYRDPTLRRESQLPW